MKRVSFVQFLKCSIVLEIRSIHDNVMKRMLIPAQHIISICFTVIHNAKGYYIRKRHPVTKAYAHAPLLLLLSTN